MKREVFVTATYKFAVPDVYADDESKAHYWMNNVCEGVRGLQVWVDGGEQQEYPMEVSGRVVQTDGGNARLRMAASIFGQEYVRMTPQGGVEYFSVGEDNGAGKWRPWNY